MEPSREADELARTVIGSSIEVHRELGPGYSEGVYEEALAQELFRNGVRFELISYLKATSCSLGLLIDFNENLLRSGVQRVVFMPTSEPALGLAERV